MEENFFGFVFNLQTKMMLYQNVL